MRCDSQTRGAHRPVAYSVALVPVGRRTSDDGVWERIGLTMSKQAGDGPGGMPARGELGSKQVGRLRPAGPGVGGRACGAHASRPGQVDVAASRAPRVGLAGPPRA